MGFYSNGHTHWLPQLHPHVGRDHTNLDLKPRILVIEALAVLHLTNKQQQEGMLRTIFRMLKGKQLTKTCLKQGQFQQRHPTCIQYASSSAKWLETIPGAVLLALSGPGGCVPCSCSVGVT
jgi:hypothetical protein